MSKIPEPKRAYRVEEFVNAVGIGRTSLYKLLKEGKLRSVVIAGRRLIPATEVARLLNGGTE